VKWVSQLVISLRGDDSYPTASTVAVASRAPLLSAYLRLPGALQLLYGLWAAIALSFLATGSYILYLRIASASVLPFSAGTILVVGGAGLLYECVVGIEMDASH
jgi:hypothetical protein